MAIRPDLHLPEEILLLALRDDKGTIAMGSYHVYAVGGAILAELLVRRRLELQGKKRIVHVLDPKPVGATLLDESLRRIVEAKRRGTLATWVGRLGTTRGLHKRLAEGLCQRGVLRAEDRDFLLFFKRRTYPEVNPGPEQEIVKRLRKAIFTEEPADARTVTLLSLANAANLLQMVFDKKEIKTRRGHIKALIAEESVGQAVKAAIEAAQSSG